MCVVCEKPFDSMLGRLPYDLPCKHVSCMDCIVTTIEVEQRQFICPLENAFLNSVSEAVYNKDLFRRVKIKERELTTQFYE